MFDIDKLRFWSHKIIPLVYDDSMSYYEVLCKVAKKLNEVIENVDKIPEYIAELISDDRLKDIIQTILNNLQDQIASANEGESETATADRVVGELVWLNGDLYSCIKEIDTGDRYVVNANVEKVTIEKCIKDLMKCVTDKFETNQNVASADRNKDELIWYKNELYLITNDITEGNAYTSSNCRNITIEELFESEVEARTQADTALGTRIDNEIEARTQADTALGERIDGEIGARTQADTALGERISNESEARAVADETINGDINDMKNGEIVGSLQNQINSIENTISEITSTSNLLDVLTPIMKGSLFYDGGLTLQGGCMISENTMVHWLAGDALSPATGGVIRIININDGTYNDYQTNIISHANSFAYNGEIVAFIGGYMQDQSATQIFYFNPSNPSVISTVDMGSLIPAGYGDTNSYITWDNDNRCWIIAGNKSFAQGKKIIWLNEDFSALVKEIVVSADYLTNDAYSQDMCYDGKYLYILMLDPYTLVTIDASTGNIVKCSTIEYTFSNNIYINEIEAIDYYNGKFYIASWTSVYASMYGGIVLDYGYFEKTGNTSQVHVMSATNIYVNSNGGYDADGSVDKPFPSFIHALACNHGTNRIIRVMSNMDEPLAVVNDKVTVVGNSHQVNGIITLNSNVNISSLYVMNTINYYGKAFVNASNSMVHLNKCISGRSAGNDEYEIQALSNSIVCTNNTLVNCYRDDSSSIVNNPSNIAKIITGPTNSFTITVPSSWSNSSKFNVLLVLEGKVIAITFAYAYDYCVCDAEGVTVSKSANSYDITVTLTDNIPTTMCNIIPLY